MLLEAMRQDRPLEGIQYLRALAATMVVLHHGRGSFGELATDWSAFGARGVDLFFVISGFIMAYVTRHVSAQPPLAPLVKEFLLKRVIRIVPLYWIALTFAAHSLILAGGANTDLLRDYLFIPHYPPGGSGQPVPHLVPGWTINYEMFFYFVFGLCMFAGRYRYTLLYAGFLMLILAGMLFQVEGALWEFYTNQILFLFLCGVALFHIASAPAWQGSTAWHVAAVVLGAVAFWYTTQRTTLWYLSGLAAMLLVWGAMHLLQGRRSPMLLLVGDASYSLYLFHVFVIDFTHRLIARMDLVSAPTAAIAFLYVLQTAACIAVAVLVYRVIEQPLLRFGQRKLLPVKRKQTT